MVHCTVIRKQLIVNTSVYGAYSLIHQTGRFVQFSGFCLKGNLFLVCHSQGKPVKYKDVATTAGPGSSVVRFMVANDNPTIRNRNYYFRSQQQVREEIWQWFATVEQHPLK